MRKTTLRTSLLLAVMLVGILTAASNSAIKEAKALPYTLYTQELGQIYSRFLAEVQHANDTRVSVEFYLCGVFGYCKDVSLASWNTTMLLLQQKLASLIGAAHTLPYTPFSMDVLLLKFDDILLTAITAEEAITSFLGTLDQKAFVFAQTNPPRWEQIQTLAVDLSHETPVIKNKIIAIGFLLTKAKLEMLEVPRLQCFPLRVAVAGKIDCIGHGVNGTMNLKMNNTQTKQMTDMGSMQADSFFDVFFEITLPASAGAGHYQMIGTDTGGNVASSFFDVFVSLPTAFEPTTIIPITVLIASIATLAVASHRARRPV